ncbi:Uncharacterised protein [Priestia megaterium]|uniref:hypothetical protein n=1 Tax=Priestia megaterium TaxID=1404 RepID=UPI000E195081|nr:hypothetical protein [Priestia megaterium]SUV02556.1 Uncharacterised protein [Priestia megaterium]
MKNPTRSDFFIVMSILAVLIGEQSGDSCGISGRDETPQERKAKSCTEINSRFLLAHVANLLVLGLI